MKAALDLMLVLMRLRVEHVYFIYNSRSVIRPIRLQLMADDKQEHWQSIRRILTQCTEQHRPKQQLTYLKQTNQQINGVHQYLTSSLNLLNLAQDGISDYDPCENMRVSGIEFETQSKLNRLKEKFLKQAGQSRKSYFNSILSQRRSSSLKSQPSNNKAKKQEDARTPGRERPSLPILIKKFKKTKKPANASRNSSLQYEDQRKKQAVANITYECIKQERQKVEEIRHLTVLGRVMGENYKKHLKKIEERRKLFLRIKTHNNF